VLYTNQWNLVRSVIGTVAKGKTIDRILVGYDNRTARRDPGLARRRFKIWPRRPPPASTRPPTTC